MYSQMPHSGFSSLLEQFLSTALSDTINSATADTEIHTDGEHWPQAFLHGHTVFRMVSDTESRANLESHLRHKPTLLYAVYIWHWSTCHSSSICPQSIQHFSSLKLTDRSSLVISLQYCNSCFQSWGG